MDESLIAAMYEFRFKHKDDYDKDFFRSQFTRTKDTALEIINYGVARGEVPADRAEDLAMNIVFFIEGICMLGTAAAISEEYIDRQLEFMKDMIFNIK
jgi:hypothetical protein